MKSIKNIKRKRSTIIVISIIILLVVGFFGTLYYITSTVNNYDYSEKKWINSNNNKAIDIYVDPELPVFAYSGSGVFYDYISALKEDTGLNLNINTTTKGEINLINKNSLDSEDVLFYRDHFVVIGTNNNINKLSDLENKKIGVLNSDKDIIAYHLTEHSSINYSGYEDYNAIRSALDGKSIEYAIIPMYKYINELANSESYNIVYHLDGLYSYYCLDLDEEKNETLNSIMTKFYNRWKEKANSKINSYFLNIYYDTNKYTELEKESITSEDFIVGYVDNIPYEGMIGGDFTGLPDPGGPV